ncbi:hypothetical protein CMI47_20910 [Candidatus Pacearchaeota archaeon]|nr:hypothetical protein [Candidatus Pacearchaeota archaeon]|tara:strand:- start:2783 stop:3025 length:243 start_codon:yes stop_codon:yes gene_type:complete
MSQDTWWRSPGDGPGILAEIAALPPVKARRPEDYLVHVTVEGERIRPTIKQSAAYCLIGMVRDEEDKEKLYRNFRDDGVL